MGLLSDHYPIEWTNKVVLELFPDRECQGERQKKENEKERELIEKMVLSVSIKSSSTQRKWGEKKEKVWAQSMCGEHESPA